jgi:hypothetical protein
MNQYLITAVAEKVSAQKTAACIQERIQRGSKSTSKAFWQKCPTSNQNLTTHDRPLSF